MLPKSAVLATAGLLLLLGCDEAPEQKTLTQDDAADTDTDSDATSAIPDDAEVSSEGGECPNNYTACDDRCVDLASHPEHCGACGDYCGRGESCIAAQCIDCEEDPSACDDAESGPTSSVSEPEVTAGNPEPSEEPEPQVAAEPEVATEAEPEAGAEPESAVPEPSAEPEPGMTPEPVSVHEPSIEPEPATEPEPIATEPEPLSTPEPEPAAEPEVTVETVEPEPAVEPEPIAEPEPAMDCQTLASNTNSGPLGTAEVCFEIPAPIAGWESSNIGSRTVTVNGEQVLAPALPAPVNGMYTFVFSAGEPSYTSFSYWTL